MANRFNYVEYDLEAKDLQAEFKELVQKLDDAIEIKLKKGRAHALALTKLEEAYMWIGKAIRDEQMDRA